jgi:hypothetical protein
MPQIPEVQKSIRMNTTFSGYNHKEIITDSEMYDTLNLTAEMYPAAATRRKRCIASYDAGNTVVPLNGLHGRDNLVMIRGTDVYYNFVQVTGLTVSTDSAMLPKKIVSMGAYVCIWPDKVYFNTVDLSDKGSMQRLWNASGSGISLAMCKIDGTNYDMTQITVSSTAPSNPSNGQLWMDQSGENDVLREYRSSTQEWVEVPSVYVKITGTNIGNGLKEYDGITISGMEAPSGTSAKVTSQVSKLNGNKIVYGAGTNYVIVVGLLSATVAALTSATIHADRAVPDLDFICESNNRLWGCRYGMENGKTVNEIRACKLGDFRNWNCFMGLSTDSYTASVGTDGVWTGAITQKGYPVFFKEESIQRVSGSQPSSFQISTTICRGVQRGSWRSLAIVGERIIYKSRQDVMAYDGSLPFSVSEQLGNVLYSDARAGAIGNIYYISMKNTNDEWSLFTYNTEKSIWYKEDNTKVLAFAKVADELFAINETNNTLMAMRGSMGGEGWSQEDDFDWKAEFGISGVEYTATKNGYTRVDSAGSHYLSRFDIRMYLEEEGRAELEIMYDSNGEWIKQGEIRGSRMKNFMLPVIPRRCDHLRFRIKGHGEFRIYSICRNMEVGSDG